MFCAGSEKEPPMKKSMLFASAILAGFTLLPAQAANLQTAVFAGGCFWSVEKDFDQVKGVKATVSGFAGGHVANPTYYQVINGGTGHIEAVEVTYDPSETSYQQLVHEFLRMTDVTDNSGQFCDRGEQYRTAVFAGTAAEQAAAQAELELASATLGQDIATQLVGGSPFWAVEEYHQNFYSSQEPLSANNPMTKAERYKRYRDFCGRDARVAQLWGAEAFSATHPH
jgi:peptide-methionine (S)-S-oxide reductase